MVNLISGKTKRQPDIMLAQNAEFLGLQTRMPGWRGKEGRVEKEDGGGGNGRERRRWS